MAESKITATDRLRREGRWEAASQWRDERRKQLRAEGQTRTESNEAAWQAMIDQFPPLPRSESPGGGHAVELLDINPADYDGQADCGRDVNWVYQHLLSKTATPCHAPSAGCWGLLEWARRNPDRFFQQMWGRMMPQQTVQNTEPWNCLQVKEDPKRRQIKQMIAAMEKDGGYESGDIDFSAPGSKPPWANMSLSP